MVGVAIAYSFVAGFLMINSDLTVQWNSVVLLGCLIIAVPAATPLIARTLRGFRAACYAVILFLAIVGFVLASRRPGPVARGNTTAGRPDHAADPPATSAPRAHRGNGGRNPRQLFPARVAVRWRRR
jgi:hypothetical protein